MKTANKPSIFSNSEIGKLKRVIVHRPDKGVDRILPKDTEDLLFDDIVYLPKMQEEHDIFTDVLRAFLGNDNVLETGKLLEEALAADEGKRRELLNQVSVYEELPMRDREMIAALPIADLADTLITGYCQLENAILFDPIPNFIFTRDIAVIVNDCAIITKAAKEARFRENFLTRYIFWAHPMFEDLRNNNRIINLNHVDTFPPSRRGEYVSVEGGDVMIINGDYLLVGSSERTTPYGIRLLKEKLFELGVVKHVVQINISSQRSWMHIDTLFTHIHYNHITAFKPLVAEGPVAGVQVFSNTGTQRLYQSVKEFIHAEINPGMEFIFSGNGESPYAEREQWTDGCNLVALKPGVALTYDRNERTEIAFRNKGYNILKARDFLANYHAGKLDPQKIENTIITLPSSELSRARGGSHCMTCPVEREPIALF